MVVNFGIFTGHEMRKMPRLNSLNHPMMVQSYYYHDLFSKKSFDSIRAYRLCITARVLLVSIFLLFFIFITIIF